MAFQVVFILMAYIEQIVVLHMLSLRIMGFQSHQLILVTHVAAFIILLGFQNPQTHAAQPRAL